MTDRQENKRSMYLAVQNVCNNANPIWNNLPAFVQAFQNFQETLADINIQRQIQEGKITGITQNKQQEREQMIQTTVEIAAAAHAYATNIADNNLKQRVNYSTSQLNQTRDTILRDICQNIHDTANTIILQLADYGKTPPDLAQLQQEINQYTAILANPRAAIGTKATATARLTTLFKHADDTLKNQLDKLILTYQNTQTQFYNQYQNARIIIDLGKANNNQEQKKP